MYNTYIKANINGFGTINAAAVPIEVLKSGPVMTRPLQRNLLLEGHTSYCLLRDFNSLIRVVCDRSLKNLRLNYLRRMLRSAVLNRSAVSREENT